MRRAATRGRKTALGAVMAVWVSLLLCACSTISPERPQPPELSSLRVAVTKTIDSVPLRLAVQQKIFKRAGLNVELVEKSSQPAVLASLRSGDADVALGCNLELLQAASRGSELELQGEAYISGPRTMVLVTIPGTGYDEPTDKAAPVVAIEPNSRLGQLATRARLTTEGIDAKKIRFTELRYDAMMQALLNGDADAAWLSEPLISRAQKEHGAQIVTDTARGAMLEFPISSYAALRSHAQENPRTFALFRRLLAQAQERADDPAAVRDELGRLTALDKTTMALVSVGDYPTSLNGIRLQRVADLMHRNGVVPGRIDVIAMLPPSPDA